MASSLTRRLVRGGGWLLGDRVLRSGLELFVGLWMARHLGPQDFGDLSFALALAALFGPLSAMGLQGLLIRELIAGPTYRQRTMSAAAALRFVGGALGWGVLFSLSFVIGPSEPTRAVLLRIVSFSVALQWLEVMDLSLQADDRMAASGLSRSIAAVVASGARIGLILGGSGVFPFAWVAVFEVLLWGVLAWLAARFGAQQPVLSAPDLTRGRELLSESWLLILSGFWALLNLKIDQVMLGSLVTAEAVGTYAAAARLSEGLYFLPQVLAAAAFPTILRLKTKGPEDYQAGVSRLMNLFAVVAFGSVATALLLGPLALDLLLGEAYQRSIPIFRVHVVACFFVFPGVLLSRWLIAEGHLRFSLLRHGAGATVNVMLNLWLIPALGGLGAAISTVVSYATSSYLACFLTAPTRPMAKLMTRAVLRIPLTIYRGGLSATRLT